MVVIISTQPNSTEKNLRGGYVSRSRPLLLHSFPSLVAGYQFVFTDPGTQFAFTDPVSQFTNLSIPCFAVKVCFSYRVYLHKLSAYLYIVGNNASPNKKFTIHVIKLYISQLLIVPRYRPQVTSDKSLFIYIFISP